jgi:hypothetical protein
MKKIPIILCALLLAGLGITGAFQRTSAGVESVPAERETVALCAAVEPLEAPAATPAPLPTESYLEFAAPTPASVSERTAEPPRVDSPAGSNTLQNCDDTNGLKAEAVSNAKTETLETVPLLAATPTPAPQSGDPYHTDVYPNNVYAEELIYDAGGNLIGKTTTYPTTFGPDTIWIDGHAYYDLPGFGLVEWSGPSRCTEDYTMYESGVKVGIMGGEDEAQESSTPSGRPTELPIPIEETIDQTINTRPERNSTPPDYKPELTPPTDPNARDIG